MASPIPVPWVPTPAFALSSLEMTAAASPSILHVSCPTALPISAMAVPMVPSSETKAGSPLGQVPGQARGSGAAALEGSNIRPGPTGVPEGGEAAARMDWEGEAVLRSSC